MTSLLAWEQKGRYSNLEINATLTDSPLSEADRALYTALVYGVIERAVTLDYVIAKLSSRPFASIDEPTRCALRLGLYQLVFMDRIPAHAAVSETVALVPQKSRGFANAILRAFQRMECKIPLPAADAPLYRLSVESATPLELCQFFADSYGMETASRLLSAFLTHPPVTLRINTLKTTAEEMLARFKDDGAQPSPFAADMITLSRASHVAEGIRDGLYFVQDPASRLCVRALDPKPGETVIDTCAAPGGKSFSAAIDMQNRGTLYSFDLHENKISLIRKTAAALGITMLTAQAQNAKTPLPALMGKADRVLCDAPCSGLGVIGKKPDIKYKPLSAVNALPQIQYEVLTGASAYVRPGGVLVYSTCTLNPSENEQVVQRFLQANPDFSLRPFDLGAAGICTDGMKTFFPHEDGCDGFFIAKMIRNG